MLVARSVQEFEMADDDKIFTVPFSLRLTFEERAQLEKEAAGMPLGRYIRQKALDGKAPPGAPVAGSRSRIMRPSGGSSACSVARASPAT